MSVTISINGEDRTFTGDARTPLVDVLRDHMRLTGAKSVCREGFCGACTVHVDGAPMVSCLLPVGMLAGRSVTTIEGVAGGGAQLNAVQQALLDHDVVQCGMCFPGMVMTISAFLENAATPPSREALKAELSGNACRCTGYERIIDAVLSVTGQGGAMP